MSNVDGREGSSQQWWAGGGCLTLFGMLWDGEVCAGVQSIFPFCLKPVAGAWGEEPGEMLSRSWIPSDSESWGNWRLDSKKKKTTKNVGCPGLWEYTAEPSFKRLPVSRAGWMLREAGSCAKPHPDARAGGQGAAVRGRRALQGAEHLPGWRCASREHPELWGAKHLPPGPTDVPLERLAARCKQAGI